MKDLQIILKKMPQYQKEISKVLCYKYPFSICTIYYDRQSRLSLCLEYAGETMRWGGGGVNCIATLVGPLWRDLTADISSVSPSSFALMNWCSGESTHGFSLLFGSHPNSERFFFGYSGFPSPQKPDISKFQFHLKKDVFCTKYIILFYKGCLSFFLQFMVQLHLAEDCMKQYNQTALKDLCAVEQVTSRAWLLGILVVNMENPSFCSENSFSTS